MKHYWGVIVPMAEAAGIDPWECVRLHGQSGGTHPEFTHSPCYYTFALTVLEKRPVFVGDRLYGKNLPITVLANEHFNLGDYTWTPPTPKVTPKKRRIVLEEISMEECRRLLHDESGTKIYDMDGSYWREIKEE